MHVYVHVFLELQKKIRIQKVIIGDISPLMTSARSQCVYVTTLYIYYIGK